MAFDKKKPTVWHSFASHVSVVSIREETAVFHALKTVFANLAKWESLSPKMPDVVEFRQCENGVTAFHQLCQAYANVNDFRRSHYQVG